MDNRAEGDRVAHPLFQEGGGGSSPTSALQLEIAEVSRYTARDLNAAWHSRLPSYETGFCLNSTVSYAAYFRGRIYAVAIWTNPVARSLPQRSWLELRRMAISSDAPANTGSRMLAIMARLIRKKFPHVENLISYQDEQTHKGTIYRAAGWVATHRHRGGSWDTVARRRPDKNKATGPKVRWEKRLLESSSGSSLIG